MCSLANKFFIFFCRIANYCIDFVYLKLLYATQDRDFSIWLFLNSYSYPTPIVFSLNDKPCDNH